MVEISPEHLLHPNNHLPHFPLDCVGSLDTFPIHIAQGPSRYQPKYAGNVAKFQAFLSHLGLYAYLSGPHPGAMSDATLSRLYRPNLGLYGLQSCYFLADLPYISIPNMLPPFKGVNQTFWEMEFTRVHQFYRARCEKAFAQLNEFNIISNYFRGSNMKFLGQCVRVLASICNVQRSMFLQYVPYSPCL